MGSVVELDEYRPHISMQVADGSCRVIACRDVEAFIAGEIDIEDLPTISISVAHARIGNPSSDWRSVVRRVFEEWYEKLAKA